SLSVTVRAMISVPLPGVKGTMMRIGFVGQDCAKAACPAHRTSSAIPLNTQLIRPPAAPGADTKGPILGVRLLRLQTGRTRRGGARRRSRIGTVGLGPQVLPVDREVGAVHKKQRREKMQCRHDEIRQFCKPIHRLTLPEPESLSSPPSVRAID